MSSYLPRRNHLQEEFNRIMETADDLAPLCPGALHYMARLIARRVQYEMLTMVFRVAHKDDVPTLNRENFWFSEFAELDRRGTTLYDLKTEIDGYNRPLESCQELVFAWPYHRGQMTGFLYNTGEGRGNGPWKQSSDHIVEYWLPLGLCWVETGNESLAAGIAEGKGAITQYVAYDISRVYDYVYCNGEFFIRTCDSRILAPVRNVDFAVLFEIGRLIANHSVNA